MIIRHEIARLSLLIGSVVGVRSADANAHPAPGRPWSAGDSATGNEVYAAVRAYERGMESRSAGFSAGGSVADIPAFARKYGMKCSACHLAVPVLNRYGQAFKDNGFRMKNGTDDLRANDPSYWPVFAWLWKDYEIEAQRVGGRTVQQRGGFANGALVFGGLGSVSDKLSFRFLPTIYEDGRTFLDHGWIRYNQAFGTDWLNIKVGSNSFDLHTLSSPEYNMGTSRFAGLYAYSVPGSVSPFIMLGANPGIEIMGHDRGSRIRYAVNVFNTNGAPRAHCAFCAPGVFARVTQRHDFANGFLRSVQVGAFGAYATWPTGPDTSDLKGQQRFGGDLEFLLGSDVLPFRVTMMGLTGRDDRELVPTATQNPKFNAGLLQLEYVPTLPLVLYGRLQAIRNQRQAIVGRPDDFGDQDYQMFGVRRAVELNSRFAWVLELSVWRQKIKQSAPGGADLTLNNLWVGTHLIF